MADAQQQFVKFTRKHMQWRLTNFTSKQLHHWCFPMKFTKYFRKSLYRAPQATTETFFLKFISLLLFFYAAQQFLVSVFNKQSEYSVYTKSDSFFNFALKPFNEIVVVVNWNYLYYNAPLEISVYV